jgi:hypothetical protein
MTKTLAGMLLVSVWFLSLRILPAAEPSRVDATTLHKKVLTGYQGWFRCAGDSSGDGWRHWSRDGRRITEKSLTFEMWPDMTECTDAERFPAGEFRYPDGKQAELFSSVQPKTTELHFEWMRNYGIDGVFLQRFLVEASRPSSDIVLDNVRKSAEKTGRAWALCYDLSGHDAKRIVERLKADWRRLVDEKQITRDKQYVHHNGKPVLFVWGFFSDRFDAATANQIIDLFQQDDAYRATLIGGSQWYWRTEKNADWAKVFRRFDVLSPWNVGHTMLEGDKKLAGTNYWKDDLAALKGTKVKYLPVIYPGFGWTNLKGKDAAKQTIPRLGGEFFWRQFHAAAEHNLDMAYVAMFDEVDEATAIFKVTNSPPTPGEFQTYEGLPSDFYLRLTAEGTKLIRGKRKNQRELPFLR